jgi:hypothetical protein
MTLPTLDFAKLHTSDWSRLFRATYGVGPVLGPSRNVATAIREGGKDPATVLGRVGLLYEARQTGGCCFLRIVLQLQRDAGWPLKPQSERYLDHLADAPDPEDVPACPVVPFQTTTTQRATRGRGLVGVSGPVEHGIPLGLAVRWLAHKRDAREISKSAVSPQALAELAIARLTNTLALAGAAEGDVEIVKRILGGSPDAFVPELYAMISEMLREERVEDTRRFAWLMQCDYEALRDAIDAAEDILYDAGEKDRSDEKLADALRRSISGEIAQDAADEARDPS